MMYDDTLKIGINYVDKKNLEFFLDVLDEREINYIMLNYDPNFNYLRDINYLLNDVNENFNFFLKIDLKRLQNFYPDIKKFNMIGHDNKFVKEWPCPNDTVFMYKIKQVISRLNTENIKGLLLTNFRYPEIHSETSSLTCFCDYCQEKASKPNAAENIKIRDIYDKQGNEVDLDEVKSYLSSKSIQNLKYDDIIKDKELIKWHIFRCNSLSRLMGYFLIHSRGINKEILIGMKLNPLNSANQVGQIYEDLASYLDFISSDFFSSQNRNVDFSNIRKIKKILTKAEGRTNFYPTVKLNKKFRSVGFKKMKEELSTFEIKIAFLQLTLD